MTAAQATSSAARDAIPAVQANIMATQTTTSAARAKLQLASYNHRSAGY